MNGGVVEHLRGLADRQDLIGQAFEAMKSYWDDADREDVDWAFVPEELRPELGAQMLCFRGGPTNVAAPYIATNLQLYVFDYQVGWYEILTTLEGEIIQEDGSILDDYYSGGRSTLLIQRARGRDANAPREWIGLVGLKATPGNDFFPEWALGGYTTALALATDEDEYLHRVRAYFADLGVEVKELEEVEPLAERLRAEPSVDDEIVELAAALSDTSPVLHRRTIHTYGSEEDEDEQ